MSRYDVSGLHLQRKRVIVRKDEGKYGCDRSDPGRVGLEVPPNGKYIFNTLSF
jgi:hypothetical protein